MNQKIVKWICRGLAFVMALVLLLGLIGPALAAEETVRYVSLGDSMTNGYGLNGYNLSLHTDDGTECTEDGCTREHEDYSVNGFLQGDTVAYPALFAEEYGYDLTQLAMSGLRGEDVLYLLTYGSDDESYMDEYTYEAGVDGRFCDERLAKLPGMEGRTGVEAVAKLYQESVNNADVISISLGYNNFGTFLTSRLCYEISRMGFDLGGTYYESDLEALLNHVDAPLASETAALAGEMIEALGQLLMDPETTDQTMYDFCASMLDAAVYSYVGFIISYRGILDYIAQNNPDAEVMILNLGNAMEGIKFTLSSGELDLGQFFGYLIDSANAYLSSMPARYPELNLCYVEHEAPALMIGEIAAANFTGNDVLRERIIEKCCDMVFPFLGMEGASLTLEQVEAVETALNAGEGIEDETEALLAVTAALGELDLDVTYCAAYLGIEKALTAAAGEDTIDSNAITALMEEGGVEQVFGNVLTAYQETLNAALAEKETTITGAAEALGDGESVKAVAAAMEAPAALANALDTDTVHALLHLFARFLIGDGIGCHPSAAGYDTVYQAMTAAYTDAFHPEDTVAQELRQAVESLVEKSGLTRPEGEIDRSMTDNYVVNKNSYYVAIGGASAYGDSYVPLVAEALDIPCNNLTGRNMLTAAQTLATIWLNRDEIEKADLITVGCQTSIAAESLLGNVELDWASILGEEGASKIGNALASLKGSLTTGTGDGKLLDVDDAELLTAAVEAYAYGCAAYAEKLPDIVERIRKINGDAVVIIVGMYDPLENVSVTVNDTVIELDGLLDGLTEAVNLHAAAYCKESCSAIYVDAPEVQTVCEAAGTPLRMNASELMKCLLRDDGALRPSENGHAYIRDRILSSLIRVCRVAGENRFATAIKVADELKATLGVEKFDSILIASGTGFADALSGSYLAAVKRAPILLSYTTQWNRLAADYVKANLAENGTVYILGGPAAVPEEMETMLEGCSVKRLAGADRFETNLEVLKEAGVGEKEILVCTGADFADSLSASAAGLPILLVYGELTDSQKEFLSGLENSSFTVIGGELAVTPEIEAEVAAYGQVDRVSGENRIETSLAIARKYFPEPRAMVLASASNYPDGLCGGVLAGSMDAPLLLTMPGYGKTIAVYTEANGIQDGIVLGGRNAVTDAATRAAFGLGARVEIPAK